MSGPQFEMLVSSSSYDDENIDRDRVNELGKNCYKCEEQYPILFKGLLSEMKRDIINTLLSTNPSSSYSILGSCKKYAYYSFFN